MKRLLHISLIILLSGLPTLFAQNYVEMDCCHSNKGKEVPMNSCCTMQEEAPKTDSCSALDLASSSLDNCGCIHDYTQIDQSILNNFNTEFSKTLVEIDSDLSLDKEILSYSNSYFTEVHYNFKIPIYISISSYLI